MTAPRGGCILFRDTEIPGRKRLHAPQGLVWLALRTAKGQSRLSQLCLAAAPGQQIPPGSPGMGPTPQPTLLESRSHPIVAHTLSPYKSHICRTKEHAEIHLFAWAGHQAVSPGPFQHETAPEMQGGRAPSPNPGTQCCQGAPREEEAASISAAAVSSCTTQQAAV